MPRIDQAAGEAWTLKVHGLVANPVELRIADLKSRLETITLPVTFVCAGNRRKVRGEQAAVLTRLRSRISCRSRLASTA